MQASQSDRDRALERLAPLVGEWTLQASFPNAPQGRVVFEWELDSQFLVERSEVPHPDAPDALAIIAVDDDGETYTQHYFDSRGVVRVYSMTLRDRTWTLLRTTPDFTPLAFSQRFVGTFSDDGKRIEGTWEISHDGEKWEKDFDLTFVKAGS